MRFGKKEFVYFFCIMREVPLRKKLERFSFIFHGGGNKIGLKIHSEEEKRLGFQDFFSFIVCVSLFVCWSDLVCFGLNFSCNITKH